MKIGRVIRRNMVITSALWLRILILPRPGYWNPKKAVCFAIVVHRYLNLIRNVSAIFCDEMIGAMFFSLSRENRCAWNTSSAMHVASSRAEGRIQIMAAVT